MDIESNRKRLLKQQTALRQLMGRADQFDAAMQLFIEQHAALHAANMTADDSWSFADAVLNDMTEAQVRRIPRNGEHSVAWCFWHIARIEDVAMNLLVANNHQVLHEDDWLLRLGIASRDTGNAMDTVSVAQLSDSVVLDALWAYRTAVGRRTHAIVAKLTPGDLKQKVDPQRIQRVLDEEAVVEAAQGIADYWGKRTIAGLLLMPATRHSLVHLNEALKLKGKRA